MIQTKQEVTLHHPIVNYIYKTSHIKYFPYLDPVKELIQIIVP